MMGNGPMRLPGYYPQPGMQSHREESPFCPAQSEVNADVFGPW